MTATALDPPPLPGRHDSPVQVSRWPRIPTEEREVAEIIAASVQRSRNGEPASVLHEERLAQDVSMEIDRAIEDIKELRKATGTVTCEEILAWRHAGHKY